MVVRKRGYISLLKWLPLVVIAVGLFCFFHFRLYHYLSFETLRVHRRLLVNWTHENYLLAVVSYIAIYTIAVAISVPSVLLLTLCGGFLFGTWEGACYAIFSDTLGGVIFFMAIHLSLFSWIEKKAGPTLKKMEKNFQANSFNYLLTLRLIPIFPFWMVNIVAAIFGMRVSTFAIATMIGLIPSTLIYTSLGTSLGHFFDEQKMPNLDIIFQPHILLPLICLALLAVIPVVYKRAKVL